MPRSWTGLGEKTVPAAVCANASGVAWAGATLVAAAAATAVTVRDSLRLGAMTRLFSSTVVTVTVGLPDLPRAVAPGRSASAAPLIRLRTLPKILSWHFGLTRILPVAQWPVRTTRHPATPITEVGRPRSGLARPGSSARRALWPHPGLAPPRKDTHVPVPRSSRARRCSSGTGSRPGSTLAGQHPGPGGLPVGRPRRHRSPRHRLL